MGWFSSKKSNASGAPNYTQLQVQTSAYGLPLPIVYGTTRVSGNLIDYQNFQQHVTSTGSAGGKGGAVGGGGGKGAGTTSTTYSVDFLLALCEGPITAIGSLWKSQSQTTIGSENLTEIQGHIGQSPWSYWQDNYPSRAVGYSGICYLGGASYSLGNSAQLPNFNVAVAGFYAGSAPGTYGSDIYISLPDADPSMIVPDMLTNAQYGAGFPSGRVAELTTETENHTVPSSGPYQVTVNGYATFAFHLDVVKSDGTLFTCVSGAPAAGQYSYASGVYTFNAADAGAAVTISYAISQTLANYHAWCLASGLWLSLAISSQQDTATILTDIGTATHADPVWSAGYLRMVPRGTVNIAGNGYSWTAPSAPVVALTDDDLMRCTNPIGSSASAANDDPVILSRKRASDQINDLKFEVLDRANQYAATVVEITDQALIDRYGRRTSPGKQLHMFCDVEAANRSGSLQMQDQYIRNTYSFQTDCRFCFLDPGDIISLTSTNGAFQITGLWVRLTEIQENSDGTLSFAAEEYPTGTGAAPLYALNVGQGYAANFNASPGSINTPIIFEPPLLASDETLEIWMAVSGASGIWGGCEVWAATDGTNYDLVTTINGNARMGTLNATLPTITPATTGDTIDAANTLSVDLTESAGTLVGVSLGDALAYNTLSYVGGELVAYRDATLTATSKYDLGYLVRGVYGSTISAHAAGASFARLDGKIAKMPYTQDRIGQAINFKFRSFNIFGAALQDLADVPAYSYTITGNPLSSPPPDVTNLNTNYIAGLTQLQWTPVADLRTVDYEIRIGNAWASAQFVGRTAQPPFPLLAGDGTYWVAAHVRPAAGLNIYSDNPVSITVAGATLVRNVVASYNEGSAGWTGTLTGSIDVLSGDVVTTGGGDFLTRTDFLAITDFLYGGSGPCSGTYTSAHVVDTGRAAASYISASFAAQGVPYEGDFLSISNFLSDTDLLGNELSSNIDVELQIGLSDDGISYTWQNYQPGQYNHQYFQFRAAINSYDGQTQAILSSLVWTVDMPDRIDNYVNISIPAGGLTLQYQPAGAASPVPFNGGPGSATVPAIQVTWTNGAAGDVLAITGETLSQVSIQILNGGVGVARTGHITVQGH